ncbi:hypothetical protein COOONC_19734, partial [Cooperia oncophora]
LFILYETCNFLAPADIIQVATSLIAFRYPLAGWSAVLDKPYIAKAGFALTNFSCNIELFTQLMLSINRLTAICYPMKHNRWWTLRRTIIFFACGAIMSMVTPTIRLLQDAGYVEVDGKIVPYLIQEKEQKVRSGIGKNSHVIPFWFPMSVQRLLRSSAFS